jgi:tRNA(fMet)-specific endonuclease VapC
MYILDTNICIYIMKQRPMSVLKKFESLPIGSVGMSVITYGELEFGALRSNNSSKAKAILDELKAYIPPLALPIDTAREYGDIRAALSAKGTPIGNNDLWIAAHTRSLGHTLVSNNIREFARVDKLKVENWVDD